jgi:succinate-semialdehyde dehydrogenase/glutarate-semialdehyde dehydrogenase
MFLRSSTSRPVTKRLQLVSITRSVQSKNNHHEQHESLKQIKHQNLINHAGYINGQFTRGSNYKDSFPVINPATGKPFFYLPAMNEEDVKHAISAASKAFKEGPWKETTAFDRAKYLKKFSKLMEKYNDDLAIIMTLESGKPLKESKGELAYAKSFVDWFAEEAIRIRGDTMASPSNKRKLITIKQPVGVCALVTPWNFPSAMITRKLAPALAAGCTAVIKPASETPLSALALCVIAEEAGIPPGVVNCVTASREHAEMVGLTMCHSKEVRKISFTGSTAVGKWLMKEASSTVKKISLELGGNAPFIVFDDADLDVALTALMGSKFRNAGQACIASNRIFVQEGVYEQFSKKVTEAVKKLQVGNGFEEKATVGPLINKKGLEKV